MYPAGTSCIAMDYAINGARPTGYKKRKVNNKTQTKIDHLSCISYKSRLRIDEGHNMTKNLKYVGKNRRILLKY